MSGHVWGVAPVGSRSSFAAQAAAAVSASSDGTSVCVLSMEECGSTGSSSLMGAYRPDIADVVDAGRVAVPSVMGHVVTSGRHGVAAVLSPSSPDRRRPSLSDPGFYNQVLDVLVEHFDVVVLEAPQLSPYDRLITGVALERSGHVIVPFDCSLVGALNARNALEAVSGLGQACRRIAVTAASPAAKRRRWGRRPGGAGDELTVEEVTELLAPHLAAVLPAAARCTRP